MPSLLARRTYPNQAIKIAEEIDDLIPRYMRSKIFPQANIDLLQQVLFECADHFRTNKELIVFCCKLRANALKVIIKAMSQHHYEFTFCVDKLKNIIHYSVETFNF